MQPDPDSFFAIKQPKRHLGPALPEPIDPENISWRDIKPDKQYETVRKLYFQEQKKKRKYS